MSLLDAFIPSLLVRRSAPALDVRAAGGRVVTLNFGEVHARATRMAGVLARRGLRAGDRLATQLDNGPVFIDLFLACLARGVVLVPMSVLYRRREVGHVVGDAEPRAVVTKSERADPCPATPSGRWRSIACPSPAANQERPASEPVDRR